MNHSNTDFYKSFIIGLFSRCRPHTKDLAWEIVVYLSTIPENVTKVDIENHLKKTISYDVLKKLVEKELITRTDWNLKRMLVDKISKDSARSKSQIAQMCSNNYLNLCIHASKDLNIQSIIDEIFLKEWITNIDPISRDFIRIYNLIVDIIIERELYDIINWYSRIEWRRQSASKYKLNSEYLEMFEKEQIWSLQKAMESIKNIK